MKFTVISILFCVLLIIGFSTPEQDTESLTNGIGMQFRLIPSGSFKMGAEGGFDDELPIHTVKITRAFYMGTYEVTQSQFEKVMGFNPSHFKGDNLPVEQVSWQMADEFCRKLSVIEGATYRLPTEAEWEYAARGGVEGATHVWGNQPIPLIDDKPRANVADLAAQKLYPDFKIFAGYDDGHAHTAPVGSFTANGFGLHDMAGNVWEWCSDYYGENYYTASPASDPKGPGAGKFRIFRGGCWDDGPKIARAAQRGILHDGKPKATNGFRVVMVKQEMQ